MRYDKDFSSVEDVFSILNALLSKENYTLGRHACTQERENQTNIFLGSRLKSNVKYSVVVVVVIDTLQKALK